MPQFEVKFDRADLRAFEAAIRRNSQVTQRYAQEFFVQANAEYNRKIIRDPWEVGGSGGGAPVDTGRLRDTHGKEIRPWEARIYPTANYSWYVHEGTSRMEERPWMEYAFSAAQNKVQEHADDMLLKIVKRLAD